jgi:zinc-binding in reverse transcriptase
MPLKVKIFLWLVKRNRVLTKLNLAKKGWSGNTKCVFCDLEESTNHLFVSCPFVNQIWQ